MNEQEVTGLTKRFSCSLFLGDREKWNVQWLELADTRIWSKMNYDTIIP